MKRRTVVLTALYSLIAIQARAELPPVQESDIRGLCGPSAAVRFSCTTEKTNEIVSVCFEDERLTFRFGKPSKIDVALPQDAGKASVKGWSKKYSTSSDGSFSVEAELSFQKDNRSYVVAHTLYDDKESGFDQLIIKEAGSTVVRHSCNTERMVTGYVGDIVDDAKRLGYSVTQE
jgi:hypothetical protein